MKKVLLILLSCISVCKVTFAQWTGGSLTTDNIYREGNIGIGTSTAPPGFATLFLSKSLNPQIVFQESAGAVNQKIWAVLASGGNFRVIAEPDDYVSTAPVDAINISRSGVNIGKVTFPNGNVGIGTTTPRGKFDVDGAGDIYLSDDPILGTGQNLFLPGHIFIAPYSGNNVSYLQARRSDNSGTTSLRFRTYNNGSLTEACI